MPERVLIREVGPRDGFQNEPEVIPTDDKVRLTEMLDRANIPEDVSVSVLIPNEKGLDNALSLRDRFHEVNVFLSATETHNRKNVNRSVEESLAGLERVFGRAGEEG